MKKLDQIVLATLAVAWVSFSAGVGGYAYQHAYNLHSIIEAREDTSRSIKRQSVILNAISVPGREIGLYIAHRHTKVPYSKI